MSRLLIVVEKASDWGSYHPSEDVILAKDYLRLPIAAVEERTQVINLCRSYRYLGTGYYVSLLAEARGHKVIPSVRTLNDLRRRSLYGFDVEDLNLRFANMQKQVALDHDEFEILVCFGETDYEPLRDIARQVFEAFRCPILRIGFEELGVESVTARLPASRTRTAGLGRMGFRRDGEVSIDGVRFIRFRLSASDRQRVCAWRAGTCRD